MSVLTQYDFNDMDEKGKGEAVFSQGTFVDDRDEDGLKVQLYRLDNFYVEVYYNQKKNEIIRYRSFSSPGQLAPYVKLN